MDEPLLISELTVAELLKRWNQAAAVFVRFRMACVGCPMSAFETIETAATNYHIPPESLSAEIAACLGLPALGMRPPDWNVNGRAKDQEESTGEK